MDQDTRRRNETIDIHYSDSGGTNNMNFSFVTRMSIPIRWFRGDATLWKPLLTFSADGSKFAMATDRGGVSVWDNQSKVPLKTFMDTDYHERPVRYLQFTSGKLGKETLVFVEVRLMFKFCYPYLSNRWSESLESFVVPS